MFAALGRWLGLWGEETNTKRNIVRLEDIPTWTDLYYQNKEEFSSTLSGWYNILAISAKFALIITKSVASYLQAVLDFGKNSFAILLSLLLFSNRHTFDIIMVEFNVG